MKPKLKLGIQCQEKDSEVYRYNQQLKPIVIKSINIVDREHYQRLAADNPGVELVYRQHVKHQPYDDPENQARAFAELIYGRIGHIPEITLVEGYNEWVHAPPHSSPEMLDRADRFMFAFISWVHELWNERVHAVVLNASCGHFNEDIVDFFPRTLARLQLCSKCLLALHEYDHPNSDMLGDGGHHLCGKFLRNLVGLKQKGYDKVRIAITECGVDSGVGAPAGSGHVGFKYWGEQASVRYLNERNLAWYIPLAQETAGVAWLTLFGCGMHGDWSSFDIKNFVVIDGIGTIYDNWIPPNGGDLVVKVIDRNYVEQTEEWAKAEYGIDWTRAEVQAGEKIWRLTELWEVSGPHSHITQTLDQDGNPLEGVNVAWYWPDAPDPPEPPTALLPHDWHSNFEHGNTNANGDVGPGMGGGAARGKGECGPHKVWIRDPEVKSDLLKCVGWRAMTPHDHLNCKYKLMQPGEPPPPPPTGRFELVSAESQVVGNVLNNKITLSATGERDFEGIEAYLSVEGSDIRMGPFSPIGDERFVLPTYYEPQPDEPGRTFLLVLEDSEGNELGGPWPFPYETGVGLEWWAVAEWVDEPPPDGKLDRILEVVEGNEAKLLKIIALLEGEPPPPATFYHGEYFANRDLDGSPAFTRDDEAILFDWGAGGPPGLPADDFSVRWTATHVFDAAAYRFHTVTDDGVRLWVDGQLLIDQWHDQAPTPYEATVTLTAGEHDIRMEYYEHGGGAVARFWYVKL